jgi:hypothetical protein
MKNKIKTIALSLIALVTVAAVPVAIATPAYADIGTCLSQGSGLNGDLNDIGSGCTGDPNADQGNKDLTNIITTVVNIISIIVGVVAVIMIIWGGLKYITSGGESGKITSAKNTIIYALIGLVVVALAQFIVRFVLSKATDVAS